MIQHSQSPTAPLAIHIPFADFTVSWVGQGRYPGEVCFAAEEGKFLFADIDGKPTILPVGIGAENPEAVNEIAIFGENQIAVSTRDEVTLLTTTIPLSADAQRVVFHCGAQGVIATSDGRFVAPLGTTGFMTAKPDGDAEQRIIVSCVPHRVFNYYQAIELPSSDRRVAVAFAVRHGGIAAVEGSEAEGWGQIRSFASLGLDVVDVCSLGNEVDRAAVAGIAKDGTLVFIRNVFGEQLPVSLKLDGIHGVAYRIFCLAGSVVILTNVAVYFLEGLARRFLAGESVEHLPSRAASIGIEAVDANICGDRWFFVVLPDRVLRFDLNQFINIQRELENDGSFSPQEDDREWATQREPLEHIVAA